jgi:hypothetical protein
MKSGIELIAEERQEQIEKHGFDVNRDVQYYSKNELVKAAMYCLTLKEQYYPKTWGGWFREKIAKKALRYSPTDFDIEMNKIAAALLAANIDRINQTKTVG